MLRLGALPWETREMDIDDIYFGRLKLMIIMAKAYLESYPLGEHRCRAMLENARHLEADSIDMGRLENEFIPQPKHKKNQSLDSQFFQRVKLLSIMVQAVAKGHPLGEQRKTVLQETLDFICQSVVFNSRTEDLPFLKVA